MSSIRHGKIRRIYYISNLAIFIIMALALTIPVLTNLDREYKRKVEQLATAIINQKKVYIKNIILEKVADIDLIREDTKVELEKNALILRESLTILLSEKFKESKGLIDYPDQSLVKYLSGIPGGDLDFSIYNKDSDLLLFSTLNESDERGLIRNNQPVIISSTVILDNIDITVFISDADFNTIIREKAKNNIRNAHLSDGGYIWVNYILNYDGGDNFAVRVVHPNLPETEGDFLSTSYEDVKGNRPYQKELEGINSAGEVFHEYYFKKMNSDEISHKLSYGKLYKDFNWIIATGVYLDDVNLLVQQEQLAMRETIQRDIKFIIIILLIVLILSIPTLINFESKINKLILSQTSALYKKNLELSEEKKKLDKAYNEIKEIAFYDPLTGLWNRRAMFNRFKEEMARSLRAEQKFCLIICDIDFFKNINDTFGHRCGDDILTSIGEILKENIRAEDSVARWGGEEFLILLNNSDLGSGAAVAEKLRRSIDEKVFMFENSKIHITMTFGVSESMKDEKIDEVIKSADNKLYYGKEHGRNLVIRDVPGKPDFHPGSGIGINKS